MHATWAEREMRAAGFLCTALVPHLLWRPAKLDGATEEALASRKAAAAERIRAAEDRQETELRSPADAEMADAEGAEEGELAASPEQPHVSLPLQPEDEEDEIEDAAPVTEVTGLADILAG